MTSINVSVLRHATVLERERESLFTITKQKHNNKPILHKLGALPEGHMPITAGYPLLISTKHSNVQWREMQKKNRKAKT